VHAKCNVCDFIFNYGHSRYTASSICLCKACLETFECPTESEWGPHIGETLELNRVQSLSPWPDPKFQLSPTGRVIETVRYIDEESPDIELIEYAVAGVPCPDCDKCSLVFGLDDGETCPKCKNGTLTVTLTT
jgi:hypothetical protein